MSNAEARKRPIELLERSEYPSADERLARLSPPVLGRHAPARHDRHRARRATPSCSSPTSRLPRWTSPSRRRSSNCMKRSRASTAPPHADHPRPRRGGRHGRPRHRDVRRAHRGDATAEELFATRATPTRVACWARCRASMRPRKVTLQPIQGPPPDLVHLPRVAPSRPAARCARECLLERPTRCHDSGRTTVAAGSAWRRRSSRDGRRPLAGPPAEAPPDPSAPLAPRRGADKAPSTGADGDAATRWSASTDLKSHFPITRSARPAQGRRGAGRRRRDFDVTRRDARPGGRVRLRQVDHRARHPAALRATAGRVEYEGAGPHRAAGGEMRRQRRSSR